MVTGLRRVVLVLSLVLSTLAPAESAEACSAASPDRAAARISEFYSILLKTMKSGREAGIAARYEKLRPAVEAVFDLPAITALITGPSWGKLDAAQRAALIDGFRHMTVANYARNFDSFDGQRFEVESCSISRDGHRLVRSRIVPQDGEPIALNYLMHRVNGEWKIVDVYYTGTISELATRRAEFSAILRADGIDALIRKLREVGDRIMSSQ